MLFKIATICANVILANFLPEVSRFAEKLKAPVPTPLSEKDVSFFSYKQTPHGLWASVTLSNGCGFSYREGCFNGFSSPKMYRGLQSVDRIADFYGEPKMTADQALGLAREAIKWAGYELEDVFAEEPPSKITDPQQVGRNTIPIYWFEWADPKGGDAIFVEVNAASELVTGMGIRSGNVYHTEYNDGSSATMNQEQRKDWLKKQVNPKYVSAALPFVMDSINEFVKKAGIAGGPYSTNQIHAMFPKCYSGLLYISIEFTNNFWFHYCAGRILGFSAPDRLYSFPWPQNRIRISNFVGVGHFSKDESIELARSFVRRLGYTIEIFDMEKEPLAHSPELKSKRVIPHFDLEWMSPHGSASFDVDAATGKIKNFAIGSDALPPKPLSIQVPIQLQEEP